MSCPFTVMTTPPVTTGLASTTAFVGLAGEAFINLKDTFVVNSLVDIEGLNDVLKETISKLAAVICALVDVKPVDHDPKVKGTVGITMWGITTPCADHITHILESNGYEVMVFHATGAGGDIMEQLVEQGKIDLVIDLTPAEVAHEVLEVGCGWLNHTRMTVAARCGIPQIVIPGGLDAINLPSPDNIPEKWRNSGRKFHMHNPQLKAMRTTGEDLRIIADAICERLNVSVGSVEMFLPLKGLSMNDVVGGDFYDPDADAVLFAELHDKLDKKFPIYDIDAAVNDTDFSEKVAEAALRLLKK